MLLETFTPDLERAFADISDSNVVPGSVVPEEVEGVNDDLFAEARRRFDFLTKKLIPRLTKVVSELSTLAEGNQAAADGTRLIYSVQNSPTYLNFLLLLSREKRKNKTVTTPTKKRRRDAEDDNHEYDDWF